MPTRFKAILSSYLFLIKDAKILLLQRANTGYEDGNWGVPAGHIDGDESAKAAIVREAWEETGLNINQDDLKFVQVMHRRGEFGLRQENERVDFFFTLETWQGEPDNTEPDKCSALEWFPLDNLPENTIPYVRTAIEHYLHSLPYSERGWE